jgi:hypothetical protein
MVVSNDSNIVGRLRSEFCGSHRERPVSGGDLPFVALSSTHFCGAGNAYFRPGKDIPQPPGNDNYAAKGDLQHNAKTAPKGAAINTVKVEPPTTEKLIKVKN